MQKPRFKCVVGGQTYDEVTVQQGDITRWDIARAEHGWPDMENAYNLWGAYVAYRALIREKKIAADTPWDDFLDAVETIELLGSEEVNPTPPEATDG